MNPFRSPPRDNEPERVHRAEMETAEVVFVATHIIVVLCVLFSSIPLYRFAEDGRRGDAALLAWIIAILLAAGIAQRWTWRTLQRWRRENPK